MASVKYAISAYVADGTTTDYLITWDYLDEDHIAVYVDGTSNADPTASHTFSKLNDTTLRITDELGNAIAAGAEIEIRRETPLTTRAITFADGSALLASDLNKNSDYLLYSMQEVLDTVDAAAQDGALAAQVATEGFRDEAEQHKNDAQSARDTAQTYLATVQSDATAADNHRIASAASEAAAATSEANAATSETNSANSATASANSASASATSAAASLASEQASAASETAAAASETAAAASETAAAASEAAAATSEANAAQSYDNFDDRYLGAKSTVPTTDNDGDALITGALYWNSSSDTMYVWNGASWDSLNSSLGFADSSTSTKMTLSDTSLSLASGVETTFNDNTNITGGILTTSTDTTNESGLVVKNSDTLGCFSILNHGNHQYLASNSRFENNAWHYEGPDSSGAGDMSILNLNSETGISYYNSDASGFSGTTHNSWNRASAKPLFNREGDLVASGTVVNMQHYYSGYGGNAGLVPSNTSWNTMPNTGIGYSGPRVSSNPTVCIFEKKHNNSFVLIETKINAYQSGTNSGWGTRVKHTQSYSSSGSNYWNDVIPEGPAHGWGAGGYGGSGIHAADSHTATVRLNDYTSTYNTYTGNIYFYLEVRRWSSSDTVYFGNYQGTYSKYWSLTAYEVAY